MVSSYFLIHYQNQEKTAPRCNISCVHMNHITSWWKRIYGLWVLSEKERQVKFSLKWKSFIETHKNEVRKKMCINARSGSKRLAPLTLEINRQSLSALQIFDLKKKW